MSQHGAGGQEGGVGEPSLVSGLGGWLLAAPVAETDQVDSALLPSSSGSQQGMDGLAVGLVFRGLVTEDGRGQETGVRGLHTPSGWGPEGSPGWVGPPRSNVSSCLPHAGRMPGHHLWFGEAGLGTDGVSAVMQPVSPIPGQPPPASSGPWLALFLALSLQSQVSAELSFSPAALPTSILGPPPGPPHPWCFNRCHLVCLGPTK